ncbi:tyrosine-type recombinase/integrase [Massilia sp. PWRC2]|uniref:tyrosine-type recombinase/integrase n=1 Tax=Massilia sp. PWRC2 TaxID=2804626 RepID=UPI003CF73EAC
MGQHVKKLSAILVAKLSSPGYYGDGDGLWLQIATGGSKSWVFRFTLAGKRREMGLGGLSAVSLAIARERASQCRLLLSEGRDPIVERNAARTSDALHRARLKTFDQCAAAYISAHRGSWKSAKHAAQWETSLANYASPVFGALPVSDVDIDLVVRVLRPIWDTKTETAVRLRGRIESILDWATVSKYRTGDNPARWRGHLENLLADPNKIAPVVNFPALPWREVSSFMTQLHAREGVAARAVELAILTACRSGEVRGAAWDEIDLQAQVWTVPAARMKAGKEHRIPLSTQAITLLQQMPREGAFVFPGRSAGTILSDMSLTAVLRRMGRGDITVHGFRSTFRDWCAEAVGNAFAREVCEHALAHSLPNKVEAAYRRGDLFDKRVPLMQAWADYCNQSGFAAV